MLRLSKITDYGILVLAHLGAQDDGRATSGSIASATGVPEPTVSKVLKLAASAKLAKGQRGPSGGYALTRDPADIAVAEMITAFEGPIALTSCVDGNPNECAVEAFCTTRTHWQVVNTAIRRALENVSLAQMIAQPAGMRGAAHAIEADLTASLTGTSSSTGAKRASEVSV